MCFIVYQTTVPLGDYPVPTIIEYVRAKDTQRVWSFSLRLTASGTGNLIHQICSREKFAYCSLVVEKDGLAYKVKVRRHVDCVTATFRPTLSNINDALAAEFARLSAKTERTQTAR